MNLLALDNLFVLKSAFRSDRRLGEQMLFLYSFLTIEVNFSLEIKKSSFSARTSCTTWTNLNQVTLTNMAKGSLVDSRSSISSKISCATELPSLSGLIPVQHVFCEDVLCWVHPAYFTLKDK